MVLCPLKKTEVKVGIPYGRVGRSTGTNFGYINLKECPEAVEQIPELLEFPEFKNLVFVVGGPKSQFHTIGCYTQYADSQRSAHRRRLKSSLGVVFEILRLNFTIEAFEALYHRFEQFFQISADSADSYGVEFSVGLTKFHDHEGMVGHHVAIENYGWGDSDADAREQWRKGIGVVEEFFVRENAVFSKDFKGETTVSKRRAGPAD